VRREAVDKLTDQAVLADLAKNDAEYYVRWGAVKKITDQAVLTDVAENDKNCYVLLAVAEKLTDQTLAQKVYADLASNYVDDVRLRAAEKLTDQTLAQKVYAYLAKNSADDDVRLKAAGKLTDQTLAQKAYADLAKKAADDVRLEAAGKLTDQTLAQEIYAEVKKSASSSDARREAGEPGGYSPHRGGMGEPYCSAKCYNDGGRYASSVMLQGQSGVCGFCQKPVRASMYGEATCGAVPYEGMTLFVCTSCAQKARRHFMNYHKCCMCQKSL